MARLVTDLPLLNRLLRAIWATHACLALSCLALAQASAPVANQCDTAARPSSSDGNAPITQSQAAALLEEMRRLELLLSSRTLSPDSPDGHPNTTAGAAASPPVRPITLELRSPVHALGNAAAPIVMIEYIDLQCPFCKAFHRSTFPALNSGYIQTGKVRFIVKDLPLSIHPYALSAATAVLCAEKQGKYWELRNALLDEPGPPTDERVATSAANVHLDIRQFHECQAQNPYLSVIDADQSEADRLGIRGTPTFVIGRELGGKIVGVVIPGNRSIDVYRQEIERILKEGGGQAGSSASVPVPASYDTKTR